MSDDPVAIARKSYDAYVAKDRDAIEAVIADNFRFTSPLDNRIDRKAYFARCWPNSKNLEAFEFVNITRDGDRVIATYEAKNTTGKRFRNTELLTIRDGKIVDVEVYFGWSVPHEAPKG